MATHWLTVSATASRLHCSIEDVQRLVDTGRLHGHWIHDHLSISEESVTALQSAPELATPTGDVLAAADLEDAASALLAQADEPFPAVAWTPWTGRDHPEDRDDQADYGPREDEQR